MYGRKGIGNQHNNKYPRQNFEELSSLLAFYPMKGTSFKRTNCRKSIYGTVLEAALTISCKQVTILCRHHLVWHHIWMVVTDSFLSLFLRQVVHALVRQQSHGHVQHGDVHVLPQTGVVLVIQGGKDSNDLKGQLVVRTRSYCQQWLYFTTLRCSKNRKYGHEPMLDIPPSYLVIIPRPKVNVKLNTSSTHPQTLRMRLHAIQQSGQRVRALSSWEHHQALRSNLEMTPS